MAELPPKHEVFLGHHVHVWHTLSSVHEELGIPGVAMRHHTAGQHTM